MNKPSILVTGGAGFIGSAFVGLAVRRVAYPVVLDKLTYAGHPENLAHLNPEAFELVVGDIADGALVKDLLEKYQITTVFNFAAESHVDNSIDGPKEFLDTNIMGTYALLEACRAYYGTLTGAAREEFRFVQVSTDEVYGSLGAEGAFTEDSQIQPNSPYSASKAAADHLARAWVETYKLPTTITRCSNNYGARQHPEKLIPHMISRALAGEKLPVYGNGSNVRDWIYVEDHAEGIWLAAYQGRAGEVYNFGGHAELDNLSLVKQLCAWLDKKRPRTGGGKYEQQIAFVTDRPGHDQRYAIDDSKAEKELGFTRNMDFTHGLEATVDWYLANQEWCGLVKKKIMEAAA